MNHNELSLVDGPTEGITISTLHSAAQEAKVCVCVCVMRRKK